METQWEKVLKSLEQLEVVAKQIINSTVSVEEKALKLIHAMAKEGLQNHLFSLDTRGIEHLFSNHPYLLIEYMSNILYSWKEYSNWYRNNEKSLKAVSQYANESFEEELDKFNQAIKQAEDNQQNASKLQEQIAKLEAQMAVYATPEKIEELIREKETKAALLKRLQKYKVEVEAGIFDELDAEIKALSEKYSQKGLELEKFKAQNLDLSIEIDHLESKLERTANHAKLLGEAKAILDNADQEIQNFNRKIAQENDIELRKLYVQLREAIEIGSNLGYLDISEELKSMKKRIDEFEEIFAETLRKK